MINSKLLSFVFYSFISCMHLIQKTEPQLSFFMTPLKNYHQKKKSLDTIVTDVLIWNQAAQLVGNLNKD